MATSVAAVAAGGRVAGGGARCRRSRALCVLCVTRRPAGDAVVCVSCGDRVAPALLGPDEEFVLAIVDAFDAELISELGGAA